MSVYALFNNGEAIFVKRNLVRGKSRRGSKQEEKMMTSSFTLAGATRYILICPHSFPFFSWQIVPDLLLVHFDSSTIVALVMEI